MNEQETAVKDAQHSLAFKVRDYECDLTGVVNNAIYLNYFEHARHEYLKTVGIDFAELARKKITLVVAKLEVEYKRSLVSGDEFVVDTSMTRPNALRLQFTQNIFRISNGRRKIIASAIVTGTAVNTAGRAEIPAELEEILNREMLNA